MMRRGARGIERIAPPVERLADRRGELAPGSGRHDVADYQASAMRCNEQAIPVGTPLFKDHAQPERLELPHPALPAYADPLDHKCVAGKPDRLAPAGATIIEKERKIDEGNVEPKEPRHRPSTDRDKPDTDREADQT